MPTSSPLTKGVIGTLGDSRFRGNEVSQRLSLGSWRGYPRSILAAILICHFLMGCSSLFTKKDSAPSGARIPGQVLLQWKGDPNVTFNVYRRSENGNDIKINSDPIKPLEAFSGGKQLTQFEYVDRTVLVGEEYYYTLETIDQDGKTSIWESAWKMTATSLPESSQPK